MPPTYGDEVVVIIDMSPGAIETRNTAQVDSFLQMMEQRLFFRIE